MLLSINPEYVARIIQGDKLFEYRKFRCRNDVDKIVIYATAPTKAVIGEVEIAEVLEDDVLNIWQRTREHSGITYPFFRQYYKGKKKAFAYRLKNMVVYDEPQSLEDIGVSYAPQSFRYLSATTRV
jgi:predicted transcriptional regulator